MKKLLIIDDDDEILSLIKDIFIDSNYLIYTANNTEVALKLLENSPDIILLDVMMPGKNGFEFCDEIRSIVQCPIIFITAKSAENDIVKGFALGGDDYITKPFNIKELRARVMAHIRRTTRDNNKNNKYLLFDNLKINLQSREVLYFNEEIVLTKREYDILELLALNNGQIFSKDNIYEKIWGYEAEGDSSTVSEHIKKLRSKFLAISSDFKFINTVWGVGYKWNNKGRDR